METIKTADQGCIWLFGHRSKSVEAGLAYCLAVRRLCLWHNSPAAAAVTACGAIQVLCPVLPSRHNKLRALEILWLCAW